MTVDISACGRFVRVSVNGQAVVMTKSDWSKAIAFPGEFTVIRPA